MARKNDLSKPKGSGGGAGYDSDAFARWAESVARFLGTGRYLAVQTIFVIIWIAVNAAWLDGQDEPLTRIRSSC